MTYFKAFRHIVDRVNASRGDRFEYKPMGTLVKWEFTHDTWVRLDALTLRMQLGPTGKNLSIAETGREAQPADVERVAQEILEYFTGPALEHEKRHAA